MGARIVKGWLARAVAGTVARGDATPNRITRWSRWLPRTPAVDPDRFQDEDEPYPGHWRQDPEPWPGSEGDLASDPVVRAALEDGLRDLPPAWRAAVRARDLDRRPPQEVADSLGVTGDQERDLLNRARAGLRERVARALRRGP